MRLRLNFQSGALRAGALSLAACLWAPSSQAHFVLEAPASWATQDSVGGPQKSAPCGQSDPGMPAVATGKVTAFRPGETITVTVNETVFHPGHYRVVLAVNDRSELPSDPPVTAGATACGSTVIQATPTFPVLVDGALPHTTRFTASQSFQVKLPSDVSCAKCTLQVVEFMSDHGLNNPGGCFYHHCADISIQAAAGASSSGGAGSQAGGTSSGGGSAGGKPSGGVSALGGGGQGGAQSAGGLPGIGGNAAGSVGLAGAASSGQQSDVGCGCRTAGSSSRESLISSIIAVGWVLVRRRRRLAR